MVSEISRGVPQTQITAKPDELSERSDTDIIIRMLYFCAESRLPSQIMSYCDIDGVQFKRFFDHCMKRDLLKVVVSDLGLFALVVTERGRETLTTAEEIIKALGIKEGEKI